MFRSKYLHEQEERNYRIKKSIESGIDLARVTGQEVNSSPDQLFDEAKRLDKEAARVGWNGLFYIQLHMGNIAFYSNEDFVVPTNRRDLIVTRDSAIWDPMGPREWTYGPEEVDALKNKNDFEPHIRMAVINPAGSVRHYEDLPYDGVGDTLQITFDSIESDLEVIKPSLNVATLNFMGILALNAAGYAKHFKRYVGPIETLVPLMEVREGRHGRTIGTVTTGEGGDILLGEYSGDPRTYDEQVGIGLSVGLTD